MLKTNFTYKTKENNKKDALKDVFYNGYNPIFYSLALLIVPIYLFIKISCDFFGGESEITPTMFAVCGVCMLVATWAFVDKIITTIRTVSISEYKKRSYEEISFADDTLSFSCETGDNKTMMMRVPAKDIKDVKIKNKIVTVSTNKLEFSFLLAFGAGNAEIKNTLTAIAAMNKIKDQIEFAEDKECEE